MFEWKWIFRRMSLRTGTAGTMAEQADLTAEAPAHRPAKRWYKPSFLKVVACMFAFVLLLPFNARGQFGIDLAAVLAALSKMQSLMSTYMAAPLQTINQYEQSTAKYEQEVMYPLAAINQAKNSVSQFEGQFSQLKNLFHINVASATLPQSQSLENLLLSRNAWNVASISSQFQSVYGVVMAQNAASPAVRTMTDMTDAQAQDAMKRAIEIDALADAELNEADQMGQQIFVTFMAIGFLLPSLGTRARELVTLSGIRGPAFDPYFYAEYLRIEVSEHCDAPFDGTLRKTDDGRFIVVLNASASDERKRFTLAHEIAHTFFYYELEMHRERHSGCAVFDPEEERLCDIGAAELLMPRGHFKSDFERLRDENGSVTPETVLKLASLHKVSIRACVQVAAMMANLTCIYWSKTPAINSDWATPSKFKNLMVCPTGHSSVERAFSTSPGKKIFGNDTFYWNCTSLRRETVSLTLGVETVLSIIQPCGARHHAVEVEAKSKSVIEEKGLLCSKACLPSATTHEEGVIA